jgi:hypothetical protein
MLVRNPLPSTCACRSIYKSSLYTILNIRQSSCMPDSRTMQFHRSCIDYARFVEADAKLSFHAEKILHEVDEVLYVELGHLHHSSDDCPCHPLIGVAFDGRNHFVGIFFLCCPWWCAVLCDGVLLGPQLRLHICARHSCGSD